MRFGRIQIFSSIVNLIACPWISLKVVNIICAITYICVLKSTISCLLYSVIPIRIENQNMLIVFIESYNERSDMNHVIILKSVKLIFDTLYYTYFSNQNAYWMNTGNYI